MKTCKMCGETDQNNFYTKMRNKMCKICINNKRRKRHKLIKNNEHVVKAYKVKEKFKTCKMCGETDQNNFYTTTNALKCKSCLYNYRKNKPKTIKKIRLTPKICKMCGETDQNNFYTTSGNLRCKNCLKNENKKYYWNYINTIEDYKRKHSEYTIKNSLKIKNIFRTRIKQAEKRAKKANREFSINEDFLKDLFNKQNGLCYYSGLPLTTEGDWISTLSLERIDSSVGYTKENVVLVCAITNSMKRELKKDTFFKYIEAIYNFSIKEKSNY